MPECSGRSLPVTGDCSGCSRALRGVRPRLPARGPGHPGEEDLRPAPALRGLVLGSRRPWPSSPLLPCPWSHLGRSALRGWRVTEFVFFSVDSPRGDAYHARSACWRSSVAEQLICNQQVGGSNPFASSETDRRARQSGLDARVRQQNSTGRYRSGQTGQTVNLLVNTFGGSNPPLPIDVKGSGNSSDGRAPAFQAEGRGFDPRFPLETAVPRRRRIFDRPRSSAGSSTSLVRKRSPVQVRSWALGSSALERSERLADFRRIEQHDGLETG